MAVYTTITGKDIEPLLNNNLLGTLVDFAPISAGLMNTHYRLTTTTSDFVLTVFEFTDVVDLLPKLELEQFLSKHDFPASPALPDKAGELIQTICNKPCKIAPFLSGDPVEQANPEQLYLIGQMLADFHVKAMHYSPPLAHHRNETWQTKVIEGLLDILPVADALLIQEELGFQRTLDFHLVPEGTIHANFTPDNILFHENTITGVLDFHYACNDKLILDLANTINAWCRDEQGNFQQELVETLVFGYENIRPLQKLEKQFLTATRRTAALQIWLERLASHHFQHNGVVEPHSDPDEYKNIVKQLSFIPKI